MNDNKTKIVMELFDLYKDFKQGDNTIKVLRNVSLKVPEEGMVVISGDSGCGKSTLLHMAGLLDTPDSGKIYINEELIDDSKMMKSHIIRQKNIGFVYQHHHLLSDFTAAENVALPLIIQGGISKFDAINHAKYLLSQLKLTNRLNHYPGTMSGGEQQRTAIARALVNNPKIILADEPTGNLDPKTANLVFDLFLDHVKRNKAALVMVTHNQELTNRFNRKFHLEGHLFRA